MTSEKPFKCWLSGVQGSQLVWASCKNEARAKFAQMLGIIVSSYIHAKEY